MKGKNNKKCTCGAEMKKIRTDMDLYDGSVVVKDVEAYYCEECDEEVFTSKQAEEAQRKLKKIYPGFEPFAVEKKIAKLGNSLSIPVSKEIADFVHLKKGKEVKITVKSRNRLIVDV